MINLQIRQFINKNKEKECLHPDILIYQDNGENQFALVSHLIRYNLKVDAVSNGDDLLEYIKDMYDQDEACSCKFYRIIMLDLDINNTGADVYKISSEIQAYFTEICETSSNPKLNIPPMIGITSYLDKHIKNQMLTNGIKDILLRPITISNLNALFTKYCTV